MNRDLIIYCDRLDPGAGMIEGLHATFKRVLTSTNPYPPRHPRMRLTKITPCKEIAEIGGYPGLFDFRTLVTGTLKFKVSAYRHSVIV
jgi:hypothetical protein